MENINSWKIRETVNSALKDGADPLTKDEMEAIRSLLWDYDDKARLIDAYRTVLKHQG